jgi:hypothetical protein
MLVQIDADVDADAGAGAGPLRRGCGPPLPVADGMSGRRSPCTVMGVGVGSLLMCWLQRRALKALAGCGRLLLPFPSSLGRPG